MFKNKKVVIAGGSGFVGQALANKWAKENDIVILSRGSQSNNNSYKRASVNPNIIIANWDANTIGKWAHHLEGADILINLSGKSVNCRYTPTNKEEIMNSRVAATKVLGDVISQLRQPPALWINAASATIYRHATDRPQDEYNGEIHDDFSVQVCKAWEASFNMYELKDTRKVIVRMAIVLGDGGVLVPYANLVKYGLGGRQGSGEQMFSWVHIEDVSGMMEWLFEHKNASGTYNVSSPNPIKNKDLMKAIKEKMKIPFGFPSPVWMLKVGATLIGTETELVLKSRWVIPTRLLEEGYNFKYKNIEKAISSLL